MQKYTEEGINLNTFKLLFESNNDDTNTIDMQLSKGLFEADYFTYYKHSFVNDFIHNIILNPIFFPNIRKRGNEEYTYSSSNEQFDFILLSKYFEKLFKDVPIIKKKLIENYKNACRANTCYYAIILACCLENSKLIIGNISLNNGEKSLHRFVEIKKNGEQYILDIAKNLIMKKSDYYQISKFEELGSIESRELRAIYNFALENGICDHTSIISMFGQEILNDLEKNNLIKKNYKLPNFIG